MTVKNTSKKTSEPKSNSSQNKTQTARGRKPVELSPFVSTKQAALFLKCTEATLRNYRSRDNCPYIDKGGNVNLPEMIEWITERKLKPLKDQLEFKEKVEALDHISIEELERRSIQKKNVLDDIKIAKELEMLIPKQLYHHQLSVLFSEFTTKIRPLGADICDRISVEKDPVECRRIIDDKIDNIISDMTPDVAINGRGEEDPFELAEKEEKEAEKAAEKEIEDEKVD